MQTPTVEPPEPVIVSSDRLRDVGPYVERLFEEDVQKWGSILPWEFPQNASRQEEEKFLRSWFSDREIHKQGGATGDGTGYRFLKQVWYSAAIYNFETRMPQVVAWWIGKNKEDWQGTFLKNNLFREGTCAKSVFDDDEKALYSMNFLEYALRLLKHELKKFHGMREDASQTTDLDCAENSEALEEHSRSSGQSEQPAEAPLGAVEGKIAPDNNAIQGRSASINFRDVKWDNPSPLSSVQEYSTGIRARTPALYGPSPSLAPETQRSIVREESLQSKRGSKARRGSNHTDRRPIFNTHRAQPSRQLNQISVAECEGDRRNTYQAQFTHNLDAQGSAFRQFANAPSMQRGPGYDAAQYGRPMPYAMGHHVSGHTPFATQIPGHLPLMNPNSYSRAPAPPAYPVEQQPIGGYPIAYEYHNPNTQYSYSQAPSGAENERPRRYSNGSRMRGAYMNARGKPPREHVANIWPGVNYANENTLPSINASGAPSQILDWRNTGDSHPPEGASAKRWSDRSYVPQSPSSRRFKMPGNMTQGPFTHGGIMEDEYSNNTGIGKHSRRVVPELPQSQLPTKKLERGPRSQPAPCSFECKKDTIDERCQEATSIVAFDIDLDVDCEELKDRFSAFGAVRNVSKVKGIIFIEFETIEGARECLRHRYAPWSTGERLNVEVSKSHWCPGWRHQQPYSRQVYQFRPVETGEQPMNDRPEYSHVRFPVGDADVKTHARATQQSNFDGRNQLMPHPDNLKKKKKTQSKKKSSSRSDSDTPPSGEQSQQQGGAKRDSQKSSLSEHTIAGSEVGQATPETTSTAPEVVIPPTCVSTSSLESEDVTVTTGQKSVGSPVNEPKKSPSVDQEQCLGLDSKPREASPSKHNQEASPEGCSSEANASRLLNNEVIEQRPGSMLTSSDVDDSLNVIEPITPEASHVKQLPEDLAAAKAPGALSSVEPVTNNEGSNAQNELGSALSNLGLALPQENVTLAESSSPVIIEPTKTAAGLHKPLSPSNQGEIRQSVPAEASVAVPNLKLGKHVASMGHEQVLSDTGASHRSSPELAKSSEPKVMGEMQATDNQAEHKPMESITLKVSKKETKEKGPSVTESFSQFSRKNKPKAKSIKGKSSMKGKTKAEQSLANTEPLVHQAHKLESPPVSFQVKVREDGASAAPADQTEESLIAGTGQEEKDSIEVIPELFVGKQGTSKIAPAWMSNLSSIWGPKQPASASREEHVETEVEACDGDIRSGSCDIEKANTEPDQDDGITTTQENDFPNSVVHETDNGPNVEHGEEALDSIPEASSTKAKKKKKNKPKKSKKELPPVTAKLLFVSDERAPYLGCKPLFDTMALDKNEGTVVEIDSDSDESNHTLKHESSAPGPSPVGKKIGAEVNRSKHLLEAPPTRRKARRSNNSRDLGSSNSITDAFSQLAKVSKPTISDGALDLKRLELTAVGDYKTDGAEKEVRSSPKSSPKFLYLMHHDIDIGRDSQLAKTDTHVKPGRMIEEETRRILERKRAYENEAAETGRARTHASDSPYSRIIELHDESHVSPEVRRSREMLHRMSVEEKAARERKRGRSKEGVATGEYDRGSR